MSYWQLTEADHDKIALLVINKKDPKLRWIIRTEDDSFWYHIPDPKKTANIDQLRMKRPGDWLPELYKVPPEGRILKYNPTDEDYIALWKNKKLLDAVKITAPEKYNEITQWLDRQGHQVLS